MITLFIGIEASILCTASFQVIREFAAYKRCKQTLKLLLFWSVELLQVLSTCGGLYPAIGSASCRPSFIFACYYFAVYVIYERVFLDRRMQYQLWQALQAPIFRHVVSRPSCYYYYYYLHSYTIYVLCDVMSWGPLVQHIPNKMLSID